MPPPRLTRCLRLSAILLLFTVLLGACSLWAQADEDDGDDGPGDSIYATLMLSYDQQGKVLATFHSEVPNQNWSQLQAALDQAIHCPAGTVSHPHPVAAASKYVDSLPAKRREQYEKYQQQWQQSTLTGKCTQAMTRSQSVLATDLDFAPVIALMKNSIAKPGDALQNGDAALWVTVSYPKSRYSSHTPSKASQDDAAPSSAYAARFTVLHYTFEPGNPTRIHLEFGLRRADILQAIALPVGFLLLPILITLWMQHAAVRDAKRDPTAAWFSYFRVLNWCSYALLLVWMLGHSIRAGIEDIFADRLSGQGAASVALTVAILILPPWIAYLICLLTSYRVYVHVRGETWTRAEFFANQLLTVAVQLLPLSCFIAGMGMLAVSPRVAMGLFLGVYLSWTICARLKVKVAGVQPEALTTGELRDHVFELARKAAVEIRQIYILPAGKSMMANAFASRNRVVMFTDYLLSRLTKREVSAVAAHEITHIQKRHVMWKSLGLVGLVLSPELLRWFLSLALRAIRVDFGASAGNGSASGLASVAAFLQRAQAFPELDLLFYVFALSLFFLQSRLMENTADTGAVQLTGDPEAVITSLLKLGRLNLMPVQWGSVTGSLLTHPSTLKRVERVARIGQVPPERLRQLLGEEELEQGSQDRGGSMAGAGERFAAGAASRDPVVTTAGNTDLLVKKIWFLRAITILPTALAAWAIHHWQAWLGNEKRAATIVCGLLCLALYALVDEWMSVWGRVSAEREFKARLATAGLNPAEFKAMVVDLSPHSAPRFYVTGFSWDTGYLYFERNRLLYSGSQAQFALKAEQVRAVRLGPGLPGWSRLPRVYIDWWDEASGQLHTWNLLSAMPCHFWQLKRQSRDLLSELENWRTHPEAYPAPAAEFEELGSPTTGEVTSMSPRSVVSFGRFVQLAFWNLVLAAAVCATLGIAAIGSVCLIILLMRLYTFLPFWIQKETKLEAKAGVVLQGPVAS